MSASIQAKCAKSECTMYTIHPSRSEYMNMQVMNCRRFECVRMCFLCLHTVHCALSVHAVQVVVLNVFQVGAQMQFECPVASSAAA